MPNRYTSSDLLVSLALSILTKEKTTAEVVADSNLPEWQVTEAVVRLVQSARQSMANIAPPGVEPDRLCFVHVEKTAGTSITSFLDDCFDINAICPAQLHEDLVLFATTRDLKNYALLRGHFYHGWLNFNGINTANTKFITFVRHPLFRQISSYKHWMDERSARDYVNHLLGGYNIQVLRLSPLDMRRGYATTRDHLQAAKGALEEFFFVGIQEKFAEGYGALCQLLGRTPNDTAPEQNVSRIKIPDLPQAMIDEVITSNWADLELYEFAVKLFDRKFSNASGARPPLHGGQMAWEPHSTINYRMTQSLHGRGWWFREGLDGQQPQSWRWTGPDAESEILFHLDSTRNYALSVRIVNAIVPELLDQLTISVNGSPVEMTRSTDALWGELFAGVVSSTLFAPGTPNTAVRFKVAGTKQFSVVDPTSSDGRYCGIAVSEINFHPL